MLVVVKIYTSATLVTSEENRKMTLENLQQLCTFYNNCNCISDKTLQLLIDNLMKKGAR